MAATPASATASSVSWDGRPATSPTTPATPPGPASGTRSNPRAVIAAPADKDTGVTTHSPPEAASLATTTNGMQLIPAAILVAAILTTGLMAGVFGLYQHTIMPGLRHTDDRTFIGAFQSMDRAIINPCVMACAFGALIFTA